MPTISQVISDISDEADSSTWTFFSGFRKSASNKIITPKRVRRTPVDGLLSVDLAPGPAVAVWGGKQFPFTVPDTDSSLWPLIQVAIDVPVTTAQDKLNAAVAAYLATNPPKGATGDKGAAGDPGQRGADGNKGQTGDKGPTGDKGAAGDKGITGDKGPTGDAGSSGGGGTAATWANLSGRPPVVAAGSTAAEARSAIGAAKVPSLDVYNWTDANTRRLQRSLGNALGGAGYSDHVVIGDSQSSSFTGFTGTAGGAFFAYMWSRRFRDLVAARGIPLGGTGWSYANDTTGVQDDRWTFTGNWSDGYGYRQASGAATATFTADVPGTAISVAYLDISWIAPFKVSVNGGADVQVTPTDASGKVSFYNLNIGTLGKHTVKLSGSGIFILGVMCSAPSGFRLHMAAQQGARATTTWGASSFTSFTARACAIKTAIPNPDVIHIAIGPNDLGNNTTSANTIAAIQAIRNQWPAADCILYAQPETAAVTSAVWAAHVANLYALADTMNVPLVDLYKRVGPLSTGVGNGQYINDSIHLSFGAEADWALLIANLIFAKGY